MLGVDVRDFRKLTRDLKIAAKSALPHAMRNSLNKAAFAAREEWQDVIKETFILRNHFTMRSILVEKTRGNNPDRMQSTVGSIAHYMDEQEKGGTVRGKSGRKPIPTSAAAGQSGGKRTKLVRGPNKLSAIHLARAPNVGNRQQRNAIAISMARRAGNKYVFLELQRSKGLFRIQGGKRRIQLRMLWDTSRSSVRVPKAATLARTLKRCETKFARIHEQSLLEQLRRHRVLGY